MIKKKPKPKQKKTPKFQIFVSKGNIYLMISGKKK